MMLTKPFTDINEQTPKHPPSYFGLHNDTLLAVFRNWHKDGQKCQKALKVRNELRN